jgi:hypothetical protein
MEAGWCLCLRALYGVLLKARASTPGSSNKRSPLTTTEGYPLQRKGDTLFGVKTRPLNWVAVLLKVTHSCHENVRPDLIYPEGQGAGYT